MKTAIATTFALLLATAFAGTEAAAAHRPAHETPRQRTLSKLDHRLPEINFDKASLNEVVNFLSAAAGVNMIIDPAVFAADDETTAPHAQQQPQPDSSRPSAVATEKTKVPQPATPSDETDGITLHLKNVPLKVVLKYVLRYKNLRYIVEDYAIVIVPIGRALPEELRTEVFKLTTAGFYRPTAPVRR